MERRNFVIVDDDKRYATKVADGIKYFYQNKNEWNISIEVFKEENHFEEAKKYIQENLHFIDVLISDQNLISGQGLELFRLANTELPTKLQSIKCSPFIVRVLQSDDYKRLAETLKSHLLDFEYFINSDVTEELEKFLTKYETEYLSIKKNGNPKTNKYYYDEKLRNLLDETIRIEGNVIPVKNILFLYQDNNDLNKTDYHFCYFFENEIRFSNKAARPQSINTEIKELQFYEVNLLEDNQLLCKINPLWVSTIISDRKEITMFTPFSNKYAIQYSKISWEKDTKDFSFPMRIN